MLQLIRAELHDTIIAIETMQATYGTVGKDVIDTMLWAGRFWDHAHEPDKVLLLTRQEVKGAICNGNTKATDSGVRLALIELLGPPGTKRDPGPTYGVTSHAWAALAVAVAAQRRKGQA